jgi:acyl transferase domain-containing protein
MYRISGGQDFAISNRVSYEYDLKGPSFTIKSGCSSSMIALHEAARAIHAGDCTSAIIAGTNLIISPTMSIAMTEQGVLSPDGACKSFDISADGYARGEAINAIYIKRLSDALRDGDNIRSVIRATASNCDGKTPGMTLPSSESHESMMRRAYKEACLDPTQTAFVEAHGTGTKIGDPLEATAIARIFGGEKGVYIGSVKPNLGHSEGASGVTSILKTVLALENSTIPPNINFSTPNPQIPFETSNMKVPVEPIPWPKAQAKRASVNSFGIGGANAHVILDSPASLGINSTKSYTTNGLPVNGHSVNGQPVNGQPVNGHSVNGQPVNGHSVNGQPVNGQPVNGHSVNGQPVNGHSVNGQPVNGHSTNGHSTNGHSTNGHSTNGHSVNGQSVNGHSTNGHSKPRPALLVLSATNTESLRANVVKHQQYVETNPEKLKDIEYNLCNRREHLSNRAFCVTDGLSTLQFSPLTKPKKTPTLVMVFTGQGAQWAEMGKELIADFPSFSQDVESMNNTLAKLNHPPSWNIKEELLKNESLSCLSKAEYAQPLVTAVQVALVNLLRQFGVKPAAVVGHSSGEIAAAYAANAITANEAIIIAYYRGQVTKGFSRRGGMAALGLGREDVIPFLTPGVSIACENSPSSVTLSGDEDALNATCQSIKTALPDVFLRPLKVEMAYHSRKFRLRQ